MTWICINTKLDNLAKYKLLLLGADVFLNILNVSTMEGIKNILGIENTDLEYLLLYIINTNDSFLI